MQAAVPVYKLLPDRLTFGAEYDDTPPRVVLVRLGSDKPQSASAFRQDGNLPPYRWG